MRFPTRFSRQIKALLSTIGLLAVSLYAFPAASAQSQQSDQQQPPEDTVGQPHPEADPSRPTVTNPAHIPPAGYLQFEQGFTVLADSPADSGSRIDRQTSITQSTKLAFNRRLLLIATDQPYAHTSYAPGPIPTNDTGDLLLTGQAVLIDFKHGHGTAPSISFSYTGRVRSGTAPSNDMGSTVQGVNLLVGGNVKKLHYDANAVFNETKGDAPQRRLQVGQTLALTYNLSNAWAVAGEIWRFSQPLTHGNAVGNLYAVTYTPKPNIVLDAGFNHGLTATSTQWDGFAGITYLLPHRLWPVHPAQ